MSRPTRDGARAGAVTAGLVLLAGCGTTTSGGAVPSPTTASQGGDGSSVVLRVEDLGGFWTDGKRVEWLPEVSVHADGRVVREVPLTVAAAGELPPLVPPMVQRTVTPAGLDALVGRARDAGVGDGTDLSQAPTSDASTTRFLLVTQDGRLRSDAYALRESAGMTVPIGEPVPSPSIPVGRGSVDATFTREQADARYRLLELAAALEDLPAALGAEAVGEEVPYVPEAVAVLAAPWGDEPVVDPVAWPGPVLPGEDVGGDTAASCLVVRGEDLAPVLDAAGQAAWWTPWTDGGRTWLLRFRPLLPDERGCADLGG